MKKRSLISITDLSREEILKIMEFAAEFEYDLVDDEVDMGSASCHPESEKPHPESEKNLPESEKPLPESEKPLMFCEEIQQKMGLGRRTPDPDDAGNRNGSTPGGDIADSCLADSCLMDSDNKNSHKPRRRGEGSLGLLRGKIIATLFFEPSTRTRLSFESAINRLGARVIGFSDVANTSVSKGETLHDTISVISNYCDMIVMRHTLEGAARYASEVAKVPVVNAGDGANQHPSQTLLDLYSIKKTQGRLEGLKVMMVGDLKYGRTVHSLLQALSLFGAEFVFVSPPELRMPAEYRSLLDRKGLKYSEISELEGRMNDVDILYMTRIQKERFNDPMEYERVKNTYVLRPEMLEGVRDTMKILHPLPRVGEILQEVDRSPHAYYFSQVENGVYARMAIICFLLGISREFQ